MPFFQVQQQIFGNCENLSLYLIYSHITIQFELTTEKKPSTTKNKLWDNHSTTRATEKKNINDNEVFSDI